MKKLTYFKFVLDLLMAVTFVLLFNDRVIGGLSFHEIAGLGIGIAFITHILLNVQWIKRVTLKLLDSKLAWKTRFEYLLNLLLLLSMTFIVVSGIFISRIVFPGVQVGNERWFQTAHISISFLALAIVGVHIGLHWKWVMNVAKKLPGRVSSPSRAVGIVLKLAMGVILVFGIYEINQTGFLQRLSNVTTVFESGSSQGPGGERSGLVRGEGDRAGGDMKEGARASMADGGFEGRRPGGKEGGPGGANPLNVLLTYLGIMGVFVILAYYLNKWFSRKNASPREPHG